VSHIPQSPAEGDRDNSAAPTPKVVAATAAAAATIIVVIITAITGNDVPAGVEGAIATLLAFAAGYLAPRA
jgi:hypothetical protein